MRFRSIHRAAVVLACATILVATFSLPMPAQSQPCRTPHAFLTSWWSFDDVSPAVARDLYAGNAGLVFGPGARVCARVGKGISLDGIDDRVEIRDSNTLETSGERTAMAWVRASAGSAGAVMSKYPAGNEFPAATGWALTIRADGRADAVIRNTAGVEISATSTTVVADGTFHHLAMSWNTIAKTLKVYVDGVQEATATLTGNVDDPNDQLVYIGARWMPSPSGGVLGMFLPGVVDEATFFGGGELPASEIQAIVTAGSSGMCKNDPVACVAPPTGMTAWWPLDEVNVGGIRVAPDINGGFSGTYGPSSFAPASATGLVSRAALFDGTNDFILVPGVSMPSLDASGARSFDAWVKTSPGASGAVATKIRTGLTEDGWSLEVLPSGLAEAMVRNSAGVAFTATSVTPVNNGAYHHLAMTWDTGGGTVKLYVDGVFHAQSGTVSGPFSGNNRNLFFGRSTDSGGTLINPFAGIIDELELFARELTPFEIQDIVAAGANGKCKGLNEPPDLAAPVIACPAPISECGPPAGKVVTFVVTASDDSDPAPVIVVTPPSGNLFPIGGTLVTATATDCTGKSSVCTFTVTINADTQPPSITAPAPIERTLAAGDIDCSVVIPTAELGLPVTSDDCSAVTVTTSGIPAGNLFPAGTTIVTWHATDEFDNESTATQLVTVIAGEGGIAGVVTADCPTPGTPLLGVRVDVFQDSTGTMAGTAVTDENGAFEIGDLSAGVGYTVTVVTPLGYDAVNEDVHTDITCGGTANADFPLQCLPVVSDPRSQGFWKHQISVADGGHGHAEVSGDALCEYLDLIEAHFNSNEVNQVVVYEPPVSGLCADKIEVAGELINLHGRSTMRARARQQLIAFLLNVASGRLSLQAAVSVDGATCSQAITYCDWLIDGPESGHELAKDIADKINNGRLVAAGVIPLDIDDIAYRRPTGDGFRFSLAQNRPNPFVPRTVISFTLPAPSSYEISIFDTAGRRVRSFTGSSHGGTSFVIWDGTDHAGSRVAPGVYFYRLDAAGQSATRRMVFGQ